VYEKLTPSTKKPATEDKEPAKPQSTKKEPEMQKTYQSYEDQLSKEEIAEIARELKWLHFDISHESKETAKAAEHQVEESDAKKPVEKPHDDKHLFTEEDIAALKAIAERRATTTGDADLMKELAHPENV